MSKVITSKLFGLSVKLIDKDIAEAKLGDGEYIALDDFYAQCDDKDLKGFIDTVIRPLVTAFRPELVTTYRPE